MQPVNECQCPNLLSGHFPTCSFGKTPSAIRKELAAKLGPFAAYAEQAVLYAVVEARKEEAQKLGIPTTSEIGGGDLVLVEENTEGERNVDGPWIGIVVDPFPERGLAGARNSEISPGSAGENLEIAIVDPLGHQIMNFRGFWVPEDDPIFVLRRSLQEARDNGMIEG